MQGAPPTPSRRYVPPRSTSVSAVLEAALRIADGEGLEALSMRRLAADLGVGAMTLYRYVATKDELFDKMVVAVLGDLGCAPPAAGVLAAATDRGHRRSSQQAAHPSRRHRDHPDPRDSHSGVRPLSRVDSGHPARSRILGAGRRRRIDVVDLLRDRIRPCRAGPPNRARRRGITPPRRSVTSAVPQPHRGRRGVLRDICGRVPSTRGWPRCWTGSSGSGWRPQLTRLPIAPRQRCPTSREGIY